MAKGYTKPITGDPKSIPDDIIDANLKKSARRKVSKILKSKATKEIPLSVGDMVEIYRKVNKKGIWSEPKQILSINHEGRYLTVPAKKGSHYTVGIEDVRKSIENNDLSQLVSDSIDKLDNEILDITDDPTTIPNHTNIFNNQRKSHMNQNKNLKSNNKNSHMTIFEEPRYGDSETEVEIDLPQIGDQISVYWPLDDQFYNGTVKKINDNQFTINYNDGDVEELDLMQENWKHQNINANTNELKVISNEPKILKQMADHFGNKQFMKHQAQELTNIR